MEEEIKMCPAITPVPTAADDQGRPTCNSCIGELSDMAVKCAKCQVFVHLRCTGLPEYQLVRLAVSQAQFSCANCVKTKDVEDEERYNAEVTKIREKIAKEISIIDQLEDGSKSAAASEEDTPKEETNNSNSKSKAICRYFLRRKCKYGVVGKDCKFEHPKLCYKYIRNGSKHGGCKKIDCQYYHPKLCINSIRDRACLKKKLQNVPFKWHKKRG